MAFHHYKKARGLTGTGMGVYYPKYPAQQREDLLCQASKLKSFGSTKADREMNSLFGNDFFITIAKFGFGPGIFPSKEVLRK